MVLSGVWRKQDTSVATLPAVFISHDRNISPRLLQELCVSVGWSRRDPLMLARALNHSIAVVSAWDGNRLVGFARATGDMTFNATIWDVVVHRMYQNRGIGHLIMQELLRELDDYKIPLITLFADRGRDHFYKEFGFASDPSGVKGMFRELRWYPPCPL